MAPERDGRSRGFAATKLQELEKVIIGHTQAARRLKIEAAVPMRRPRDEDDRTWSGWPSEASEVMGREQFRMVAEHDIVNVEARVFSVVRETLALDCETPDPDAALEEDLGVDSLSLVSLIMALEDEFGGSISEDEARKLKTLRDVVTYISKRLQSARVTS